MSILRNWTVGEVGTISAAVGILVHFLAEHPDLQQQLRDRPSLLPTAIDEILRIHGPLVANRRITTRPVEIGGRKLDAGERISLIWVAANRDGRVFEDADAFRLDRDPAQNLLYGMGIHVCPGASLASLELRVLDGGAARVYKSNRPESRTNRRRCRSTPPVALRCYRCGSVERLAPRPTAPRPLRAAGAGVKSLPR